MAARFPGVRAILFDLDGTLLDSAPDLGASAEHMRQVRGLPSLPLESYRAHAGSGARGMLEVAFGLTPEHADYESLREEFFVSYEARLLNSTRAFDGVARMLERLSGAGLAWGVVTNKAERFALPIAQALPLFANAGAFVCGDTTPHAKPHPEPLWEAARRLSLDPANCVYVGDDHRDILAGRSAGMRTVAARYGYLGPQADVASWRADAEIDFPDDLLNLVELP